MVMISFNILPIFKIANVPLYKPGIVLLGSRMEVPEKNPNDEWITLGLVALSKLKNRGFNPKIVADIGTGNGIIAIGLTNFFKPSKVYLTDIVKEVLVPSKKNLLKNIFPFKDYNPEITLLEGRDAEPLPKKEIDLFVFSPPPLMVDDHKILNKGLARTTLIERSYYSPFSKGKEDILLKWSVLPWYAFLKSAKEKMKYKSVILGIYSGRVPFQAIEEAYKRAGLKLEVIASIIKKQQDPKYLKMYSEYEKKYLNGDSFYFYKYGEARKLMKKQGLKMPGIVYISDKQIKAILKPAKITAQEAYGLSKKKMPVAHIGHALVGTIN